MTKDSDGPTEPTVGTVSGIKLASDMVAGLAAASLGAVAGIPGALAGGFAGPALSRAFASGIHEFRRRYLAPREEARIATVLEMAYRKCQENIADGKPLRDDGFSEADTQARSAAEEVLEGVLQAAQREHEEKKLPFIACFWANLGFDRAIARGRANWLLRQADEITYRQLCLLSWAQIRSRPRAEWPKIPPPTEAPPERRMPLAPELADLHQRALITACADTGTLGREAPGLVFIETGSIGPTSDGRALASLMELGTLDLQDLANAVRSQGVRSDVAFPGLGMDRRTLWRELERAFE